MTRTPSPPEEAAYDDAPYESHPFVETQPSRLAAVAALFGVAAPDVRTARVLEVGCASGGNLIPLACRYPDARFVGIDISGRQIDEGVGRIAELKLRNIELRRENIVDFSEGPFDYIIAYGVLSWTPIEVRDALARLAGDRLAPDGLFVVSYNALPGAALRTPLREIMLRHTATLRDPLEKARAAREILRLAGRSTTTPYGALAAREAAALPEGSDYYLLHEHLERVNDAWHAEDVIARMATVGLTYVAESDPLSSLPERYSLYVAEEVRRLSADDPAAFERYGDFLLGRRFRSSVFGRAAHFAERRRVIDATGLAAIRFALKTGLAPYPEPPAGAPRLESSRVRYRFAPGDVDACSPTQRRLYEILEERRVASGRTWSLAELHAALDARTDEARREIADCVAELYLVEGLDAFIDAPPLAPPGERPCVFVLARADAAAGRAGTTNLFHEYAPLGAPGLTRLLPLCDGTRTIADIAERIAACVAAGEFALDATDIEAWVRARLRTCAAMKLLTSSESEIAG